MKVVICEPNKNARIAEIGNELEDMQEVVGGYIEAVYPWEDEVAIVCNDEGKFNGCEPCRALYDDDGNMYDIVFGTFFICGCSGEDFDSLSDEMINKYKEMFNKAETYCRGSRGIQAIKYDAF